MSTTGQILEVIDLALELTNAAATIGMDMQEVAMMQQQAKLEGRELGLEDFQRLHDGARKKLDALGAAIEAVSGEAVPLPAGTMKPEALEEAFNEAQDGLGR